MAKLFTLETPSGHFSTHHTNVDLSQFPVPNWDAVTHFAGLKGIKPIHFDRDFQIIPTPPNWPKHFCLFDQEVTFYPHHEKHPPRVYPFAPSSKLNPALFLDRDGVIITDKKYLSDEKRVEFNLEILPILRFCQENQIKVIVLTNQSGVSKGLFSEDTIGTIHRHIDQLLSKYQHTIDDWLYCTDYPESHFRKPYPGMLLKAVTDWNINFQQMAMVGDKDSDALWFPGLQTFLLQKDYPLKGNRPLTRICSNERELLHYLKDFFQKPSC